MFFGAHSIIFETLFVFAGKITFRFSPRALFDLPDLNTLFFHSLAEISSKQPCPIETLVRLLIKTTFVFNWENLFN